MFRVILCLFVWEIASCSITCPDGNICSDFNTCCKTKHGYSCCPYPKAVCCADLAHCCPSEFTCNLATQMCERANQPWLNTPMVKKEAAEKPFTPLVENNHIPEQQKGSVGVVHCDNYYTCPDGTTCCRHPKGAWFCCPYSPGRCCLDGYHCCPWGYDCDYTYTHCVRQQGLRYPFTPKQALSSVPAALISVPKEQSSPKETSMTALTEASTGTHEVGVIRCDFKFFCPPGKTCCKGLDGRWNCCPYPLGECCSDGKHCCQYGYKCGSTSMSCTKGFSKIPAGTQERAKAN